MNTSSSAPLMPGTAKSPTVDKKMYPSMVRSNASTSSLLLSANPTSEPSKYICQVPAVTSPSEVGVNSSTSSSLPLTPGTTGSPVVESNRLPSHNRAIESMDSPLVSNPTSLPSKYILKLPTVLLPNEVASKRATS